VENHPFSVAPHDMRYNSAAFTRRCG
jgi:hypothetical protein